MSAGEDVVAPPGAVSCLIGGDLEEHPGRVVDGVAIGEAAVDIGRDESDDRTDPAVEEHEHVHEHVHVTGSRSLDQRAQAR